MTSRRIRKQRRENSLPALLAKAREDDWLRGADVFQWKADVRPEYYCKQEDSDGAP